MFLALNVPRQVGYCGKRTYRDRAAESGQRQPLYIRREDRPVGSQQIYKINPLPLPDCPKNFKKQACTLLLSILVLAMDRGCQTQDYGSNRTLTAKVSALVGRAGRNAPGHKRSKLVSLSKYVNRTKRPSSLCLTDKLVDIDVAAAFNNRRRS